MSTTEFLATCSKSSLFSYENLAMVFGKTPLVYDKKRKLPVLVLLRSSIPAVFRRNLQLNVTLCQAQYDTSCHRDIPPNKTNRRCPSHAFSRAPANHRPLEIRPNVWCFDHLNPQRRPIARKYGQTFIYTTRLTCRSNPNRIEVSLTKVFFVYLKGRGHSKA